MYLRSFAIFLFTILMNGCSGIKSAEEVGDRFHLSLTPESPVQYNAEKQRVLTKSPDADFGALRRHFTQTQDYAPWDTSEHEAGLAMLNALEDRDHALCLTFANTLLEKNFTSLDGHFGAYECNQALDQHTDADLHGYILAGLIRSIYASGDGLNPESAFIVNSANEARAFLRLQGLLMFRQSSFAVGNRQLAIFYAIPADSDTFVELYFDLTTAYLNNFKPSLGR